MTKPSSGIVTRQPALWHGFGRHQTPNLRPIKNVEEVLLEDGSTVFGCADCDFLGKAVMNVVRHRNKHSTKGIGTTRYPMETIAKVVAARAEAIREGGLRGWTERAAFILNRDKVPTLNGQAWLAANVFQLAHKYKDEPPDEDVAADIEQDEEDMTVEAALEEIRRLLDFIARQEPEACSHDDYDELRAKAAKFDAMRGLLT